MRPTVISELEVRPQLSVFRCQRKSSHLDSGVPHESHITIIRVFSWSSLGCAKMISNLIINLFTADNHIILVPSWGTQRINFIEFIRTITSLVRMCKA